jgi:hypothetical protein
VAQIQLNSSRRDPVHLILQCLQGQYLLIFQIH